jgi:hypothetical protein
MVNRELFDRPFPSAGGGRHGMAPAADRGGSHRVKCVQGVPGGRDGGDRRSETGLARFLAEFSRVAGFQEECRREIRVAVS